VSPPHAINVSLYKKLPYNFLEDIVPVAGLADGPNVMEVHPSVPAKTVAEFIAYAKANPGKISFASAGNGTTIHLSGELFMAMTGIKMLHVPYRGSCARADRHDQRTGAGDVRQCAVVVAAICNRARCGRSP